jgi:hypothetical protein
MPAPATPGCCGGNGGATFAPTSYAPSASPAYASAQGSPYVPMAAPALSAPRTLSPTPNYNDTPPATSPLNSSPPQTFRDPASSDTAPSFTPSPIPDPEASTSTGIQRSNMVIPRKHDTGDLTTSKPVMGSAIYRQTSAKVALPSTSGVDDGGWRPAR